MLLVDKFRSRRKVRRATYFAIAALLGLPSLAVADEVFVLTQTVSLPGLASFDIGFVDPSIHTYFLADRSQKAVAVIDTKTKALSFIGTGDFTGVVTKCVAPNACNGPDGLLTVHSDADHGDRFQIAVGERDHEHDGEDHVQVWVGDSDSTVKIFAFPSGTLLQTISTGGTLRADEGCWDQRDHLVLFANDADSPPFISFISTDTYQIVKKIKFDGLSGDGPNATNGIEQCQWNDREGRFYLNLPEVNGPGNDTKDGNVVVIDPHNFRIVQTFDIPVADCAGPQGMAIGPAPQIALGCNAKTIPGGVRNSVLINEENGNIITVLANEGGSDEIWFNPRDGHYFFANSTPGSSAPLSDQFLGVVDSRHGEEDQTVVTQTSSTVGAHSVAADPDKNQVYVPVANGINIYSPNERGEQPVFVRRDD